jgi:hypothetical protein
MPRFDGTGPNGLGPMTGRCMGSCNQEQNCRYGGHRGLGRGKGLGRGMGRCQNNVCFTQDITLEEKIKFLKEDKKRLELEIDILVKEHKKD